MTATTMPRIFARPALLSYGFRPFFLLGALQAAVMVGLWVPWYLGFVSLPSAFPPTVWHSHELLFGYVPAIVAGFLLTAVPSWTGRPPVAGWPLAALVGLWLLGRAAIAVSTHYPPAVVAAASLAFPVALLVVVAREIVAARNWRNLKVLVAVAGLIAAQAIFHYEAWRFGRATYGDRLALAAILTLIMIIGGRIVPIFTTNWLKQHNSGPVPAPFGRFDQIAMAMGVAALAAWVAAPLAPAAHPALAALLLVAGGLQVVRVLRWRPERTLAEPLVTVLHVGFAFVGLGFVVAAVAMWTGDAMLATGATHVWTVGAIGLMTLAVMTRATRGHTGRPLTAPPGTVAIFALIVTAALARLAAVLWPDTMVVTLGLAGLAWIVGFLLFAALYGPMLVMPRRTG